MRIAYRSDTAHQPPEAIHESNRTVRPCATALSILARAGSKAGAHDRESDKNTRNQWSRDGPSILVIGQLEAPQTNSKIGQRPAWLLPSPFASPPGAPPPRSEPSRRADGTLASLHLLAGLPREWVVTRGEGDEVLAVKPTVIAGFLRAGAFYTRAQAARAVALVH